MKVPVVGGTKFMGPLVVRRRLGDHADELRRTAPDVVLDMIPMNEWDASG